MTKEPKTFKVKNKETGEVITVREKSPETSVKKESIVSSEAKKIGLQFASGLALDLPNVGNKPISEWIGGEPLSNMEKGAEIAKDIPSRIKSAATAGMLSFKMPEQTTMHEKFGIPVPPQPETNVGKALGLAANIAGQAVTGKLAHTISGVIPKSSKLPGSANLKYPKPDQVEEAIKLVKSNTEKLVKTNAETLSTEVDRAKTTKLFRDITDNEEVKNLEVLRRTTADQQAIRVQENLAIKASKELGAKFAGEYEKAINGKTMSVDDYEESLKNVLTNSGILDEQGEVNPLRTLSGSERKVLKWYQQIADNKESGTILDPVTEKPFTVNEGGEISLGEFDKKLKSVLVRKNQYGSGEHILTDLRREFSEKVSELRDIGRRYADDFKARNAVWDTFKPFGRRGEEDVKAGISLFENLASENPAQVYPQNQRMMEFLKKYGGENPSAPVKEIGSKIKGINSANAEDELKSMYSMDELSNRITRSTAEALSRADDMTERLKGLLELSKRKAAETLRKKEIAKYVGATALGATVGSTVTGFIKKVIP